MNEVTSDLADGHVDAASGSAEAAREMPELGAEGLEAEPQAGDAAPPAPPEETRPQRVLRGSIDKTTSATIEGWAWDAEAPDARIRLELVRGDTVIAEILADRERRDLVKAKIGDGRHAFQFNPPAGLLPEGAHTLTLRCADTGAVMPGAPFDVEFSDAEVPKSAFRWSFDGITDQEVVGWIAVSDDPSRHCVVALKEGGRVLARGVASRFRPDLLEAGIGDGCYAFSIDMPLSLLDGAEHLLEIAEEETGFSLTPGPVEWRAAAGTAATALTGIGGTKPETTARWADDEAALFPVFASGDGATSKGKKAARNAPATTTRILFDVSDLIYYIGHHPNLTGIQRVQSSIVLSMMSKPGLPNQAVVFLSFNAKLRKWVAIPTGYLISLLRDLFLPERQRLINFPAEEARHGQLPGAQEFDGDGVLDDGIPSVLCLLGAAWVQRDYFHRILSFKRRFGTRFVLLVHDLIPIYARETSDQGTARVYEDFLRRALRHVDHYLSVSENTAKDLRRYIASLSLPEPAITVTRNGSSFDEFLAPNAAPSRLLQEEIPERFVLFVSTIEGRKNHQLVLDIWRRMIQAGEDPPHLVCVGRVGWKSERFIADLVETNYLDGKVVLLQEINDALLKRLYDQCLFTVYPSLYEGWGLPAGESLAAGKICVLSNRASLPEVAGEFGVYIDIDNLEQSTRVVRDLIADDKARRRLETKIRNQYKPTTWREVAMAIVGACEATAKTEWQPPYPYPAIPYGAEISFALLTRETDALFGDGLLNRIMDARRGLFLTEPLHELSFLRGEEARGAGTWAEPEGWGTWSCNTGGDVVVGLEPSEANVFFVLLRVRASGGASSLAVRFTANGEVAWQGALGAEPRNLMLRVRRRARSAAGAGWVLKLAARVELSTEARAKIGAIDSRVPTIGFERLMVLPENDISTRLEVLTNLVMA